jgi:hypothetical protein
MRPKEMTATTRGKKMNGLPGSGSFRIIPDEIIRSDVVFIMAECGRDHNKEKSWFYELSFP